MPIIFTYPVLLAGGLAVAAPWVIHLLMRPRPRRVIFPALAMLHSELTEGRRASRVRHIRLLLIRSIMILLLASLLAGPTCDVARNGAWTTAVNVLLVDDSPSMEYRESGGTVAAIVRSAAVSLLKAEHTASPASRWWLFRTSDRGHDPAELTTAAILRAMTEPHVPVEASTLAGPLCSIRAIIDRTGVAARILIATDMTAHAWRDVPPALFDSNQSISVGLVDAGLAERANLAVIATDVERPIRSDSNTGRIGVTVNARGFRSTATVLVHEIRADSGKAELLARVELPIDRDGVHRCTLTIPAMEAGDHVLRARIAPSDRLDFDQSRDFIVRSSPRPRVLVPSNSPDSSDLALDIVENLLAPASLAPAARPVSLRRIAASSLCESAKDADVVILTGDMTGDRDGSAGLKREIERGLNVVLFPSVDSTGDWAGLSGYVIASPPRRLDSPTRIRWRAYVNETDRAIGATGSADVNEWRWEGGASGSEPPASSSWVRGRSRTGAPVFDAFRDVGLGDLVACSVVSRLEGIPAAGSVIHADFQDGVPALWSRAVGQGRVWFVATSPDPAWSDLGQRAAGLLTLLHRIVEHAADVVAEVPGFIVGESTRARLRGMPERGTARVRCLTDATVEPERVGIESSLPQRDWPTPTAGVFAVSYQGARRAEDYYVVAWPAEESDLTPISLDEIARRLGVRSVEVTARSRRSQSDPPATELIALEFTAESGVALLLIVAMLLELVVANRSTR